MAASTPELREKHRLYMREWLKTEAGQRYQQSAARKATLRKASSKWSKAHPEKAKAKNHRRRARLRDAPGSATAEQIAARAQFWGERCWLCQGPYEEVDHVKPLAAGGTHWPANLRPVCRPCNIQKYSKWPYEIGTESQPRPLALI